MTRAPEVRIPNSLNTNSRWILCFSNETTGAPITNGRIQIRPGRGRGFSIPRELTEEEEEEQEEEEEETAKPGNKMRANQRLFRSAAIQDLPYLKIL